APQSRSSGLKSAAIATRSIQVSSASWTPRDVLKDSTGDSTAGRAKSIEIEGRGPRFYF
ncbi:hypothetical protein GBAR_LOCUS23199, partial [Geodia barretti]